VCQVCVKLNPSGRIHVIFLVEEPEAQEEQSSKEPKKAFGVDLGIARLATLSDGRFLENPKPLERSLERIRVLQRTLSRKRFLSKNWLKTKRKLAKEHEHVGDFRRDLFFKLGFLLAQEYDVLVLEDLNAQGLIQKAETRKRRLRLYDFSFSELRRSLSGSFEKEKNLFYLFLLTTARASVSVVVGSTPEFNFRRPSVPLCPLWFHLGPGS